MKRWFIFSFIFALSIFLIAAVKSNAQTTFSSALRSCSDYSQDGTVMHNNEVFHILITLNKGRNNTCVYKEKIYQNKNYQMLTCNFDNGLLKPIADSMDKYSETFKKEIAKNKIFEAKLTGNGEVFQKYLTNRKYCAITHSGKK